MRKYSIFDAHCDTLCLIADDKIDYYGNKGEVTRKALDSYENYTQIFACFIAPDYRERAMERFDVLSGCFDKMDFGRTRAILGVEGGEMIRSLEDVDYLAKRGVRCIALTWNNSNNIAGGADEPEVGLSRFGKSVIARMEEHGILVDVSHLNDRSFYDVLSVSHEPVIATHSDSRYICGHRRNLTDEMMKLIAETGGSAGINLYPLFLNGTENADIEDIMRHIEHWADIGVIDSVGIGADFDGTDGLLPDGISGASDMWKIFDQMRERGFSDSEIENVSHGNFERVFGKYKKENNNA